MSCLVLLIGSVLSEKHLLIALHLTMTQVTTANSQCIHRSFSQMAVHIGSLLHQRITDLPSVFIQTEGLHFATAESIAKQKKGTILVSLAPVLVDFVIFIGVIRLLRLYVILYDAVDHLCVWVRLGSELMAVIFFCTMRRILKILWHDFVSLLYNHMFSYTTYISCFHILVERIIGRSKSTLAARLGFNSVRVQFIIYLLL